jgi:putative addiction module component (TIGR02574 family)
MSVQVEEILNLSVKKRLQLVEEIWDSIVEGADAFPLTAAQRRELDRRKKEHRRNPEAAKSWVEVKARLEQRRR